MVDMIAGGDKEGYESEAKATLNGFDVRSRLGEIDVPSAVIHGAKDAPVPVALAKPWPKGSAAPPSTSSPARPLRQRPGPGKGSTRYSPTRSESQRNLSRNGNHTDRSGRGDACALGPCRAAHGWRIVTENQELVHPQRSNPPTDVVMVVD